MIATGCQLMVRERPTAARQQSRSPKRIFGSQYLAELNQNQRDHEALGFLEDKFSESENESDEDSDEEEYEDDDEESEDDEKGDESEGEDSESD